MVSSGSVMFEKSLWVDPPVAVKFACVWEKDGVGVAPIESKSSSDESFTEGKSEDVAGWLGCW